MSSIKLKHSGGNSVSIAAPSSNPSSDKTINLPSDETGTFATKDSDNSLQNITSINGGQLSNRNKIYNGKMEIDQRNNGSSTNIEGNSTKYHLDRWSIQGANLDELSAGVQRVDEAPEGSGFVRSLKITTNTPESSIAANEFVSLYQKMEGQDFQDLSYDTSSAKAVTMSFWVRSSVTGTYGFTIYRDEPGTDRIINKTYTINSANTWEKKTITIAGDTGRGIQNTTGAVWWNVWHLAAGSDFTSSTASSWENYSSAKWAGGHAQNGVITTNGATWQITGVQLEIGSVATAFEHRKYAQELALCQRYYEENQCTWAGYTAALQGNGSLNVIYMTQKRAAATLTKKVSESSVQTLTSVNLEEAHVGGFVVDTRVNSTGYGRFYNLLAASDAEL